LMSTAKAGCAAPYVLLRIGIRQHTSACVSIRKGWVCCAIRLAAQRHTSAYVRIRKGWVCCATSCCAEAYVSIRPHASAYAKAGCAAPYVLLRRGISIRQHTSAYVRIRKGWVRCAIRLAARKHTSAYVKASYTSSLRPHTLVA
jgi:hypothetical protein